MADNHSVRLVSNLLLRVCTAAALIHNACCMLCSNVPVGIVVAEYDYTHVGSDAFHLLCIPQWEGVIITTGKQITGIRST
jgi:hypothetical protein